MRHILSILLVTVLINACNSNKSKEETKTTDNDTITRVVPDTASQTIRKDSIPPIAVLEAIGGLTQGYSDSKTVEVMGQPDSKAKAEEWDADGLVHQDWMYRSKGITLNMTSDKKGAPQQIFSIAVKAPSTSKTSRNIGIGSDYKEVMAAYEKEVDRESSLEDMIVVGSVYGGIIFNFKNNKVEKIFIGAAAE